MGVSTFQNNMLCKLFLIALVTCSCFSSKVTQANLKKWCYSVPGLNSEQIQMCKNAKGLRPAIKLGLEKAVKMCENEFRNNPWNCQMLGNQSNVQRAPEGTKEAGFVTAITAAALALQISSACEQESLVPCSCKFSKKASGQVDSSDWKKCRARLTHTATRFTLTFLSLTYDSSNAMSEIDRHNIKTGLRVFRQVEVTRCVASRNPKNVKCSPSVALLKTIAAKLKEKYVKAQRVISTKSATVNGSSLYLRKNREKQAKKTDLVYLKQSPDYCERDEYAGIPGTEGRLCNEKSVSGKAGCATICCGRGHNMLIYTKDKKCKCEFITKCKKCKSPDKFKMVCKRCSVQVSEARCN